MHYLDEQGAHPMPLFGMFARRVQDQNCTRNDINGLEPTGSWAGFILAATAAVCLIISAGAQNVSYGWALGAAHSEFRAVILALASAGATLLAPLCFVVVGQSWRRRNFGAALVALILGLGALAYAAVCSLGTVAGSRDLAITAHLETKEAHEDRRALVKAARDELASLKGQRSEIVERRSELTAILAKLSDAKPDQRPSARPDAQAAGVAFVLAAAGWKVDESSVGQWLNIGTVLFLELAAALSMTVAAALYPSTRRNPVEAPRTHEAPAPAQGATQPQIARPDSNGRLLRPSRKDDDRDDPPPPPPKGKRGRPATVMPAEAVERLRKAGGKASGNIAGLGKLIGTGSKTATRRLLHRLAEAGVIHLQMGPHGVAVALA
jgi:hypothetical protein